MGFQSIGADSFNAELCRELLRWLGRAHCLHGNCFQCDGVYHELVALDEYSRQVQLRLVGRGKSRHEEEHEFSKSGAASATSDQRLSWHTSGGYNNAPTHVNGGWRSGTNGYLNGATNWERFVFTASDEDLNLAPVPLPASGLLLIAGFGGLAFMRKRKSA